MQIKKILYVNISRSIPIFNYKKYMYCIKQAIINKFDMISCDVKNVSVFTSPELNQGRRNSNRAGEGSTKVEGNINL